MGIFDKVRVPLAFKGKNRFNLKSTTVTTSDWFTLRPVFSRELPPNSSISLEQSYYCRLSGLQKPMFASGRVVNRAFFVRYSSIMEGFLDFISDTNSTFTGSSVRISHVPYAYMSDIVKAMQMANCFTNTGVSEANYDVALFVNNNPQLHKFTVKGRQLYSIFTGLGISISFLTSHDDVKDVSVSLMKFLAYCKIVADWYFNNNFYERSDQVRSAISTLTRSPFNPGSEVLQQNLVNLFNNIYYSVVDDDYFSTASVRPVTPSGASPVVINDVTNDSRSDVLRTAVSSENNDLVNHPSTPVARQVDDGPLVGTVVSNLTQYTINALAALTSYMQRNNIVGHRVIDRMLARFGVRLSNDVINRSYYLGSNSSELNIQEVMSNADTEGAALGAYAGRGDSGKRDAKFHFENDTKDFGCFIILSTIIPDVHYSQGITRDNLHINRLDFLTPEFDSLGPQAIARCELYYDAKSIGQETQVLTEFGPNQTFGFQPTYCEYAKADDILSGDFRRLKALDLRAFHTFRMFNEEGVEGSPNVTNYKTISENFVHANPSEFNKMFNYVGTDWDHFYLVHQFRFVVVQPKVPLVDSYEFHSDNEGRSIKVDYRGTKLN